MTLSAFLREQGLAMHKDRGQNFLVNPNYRRLIASTVAPKDEEYIWEIGPGLGSLTDLLVGRCDLRIFEIDHGFISILKQVFPELPLVEGDILKTWKQAYAERKPNKIVGNLPYTIGTTLIAQILESACCPEKMVFLLQKEAYERLAAPVGAKNYAPVSVITQYFCHITSAATLPPSAFWPEPHVDSSLVVLRPREDMPELCAPKFASKAATAEDATELSHAALEGVQSAIAQDFSALIKASFLSRRKTLRNNLLKSPWGYRGEEKIDAAITSIGQELSVRAERLSPRDFALFYNALMAD